MFFQVLQTLICSSFKMKRPMKIGTSSTFVTSVQHRLTPDNCEFDSRQNATLLHKQTYYLHNLLTHIISKLKTLSY